MRSWYYFQAQNSTVKTNIFGVIFRTIPSRKVQKILCFWSSFLYFVLKKRTSISSFNRALFCPSQFHVPIFDHDKKAQIRNIHGILVGSTLPDGTRPIEKIHSFSIPSLKFAKLFNSSSCSSNISTLYDTTDSRTPSSLAWDKL